MKTQEVKTAPRKIDAVNVVWRSHAASILRKVCPSLANKDVNLGRLSFSDKNYNRIHGYVVFYALVVRANLSLRQRFALWLKGNKQDDFLVIVKAFKNEKNTPRKAIVLPFEALSSEMNYLPNDTFRAVVNTEWRYAVRGDDCEILTEYYYQQEKREQK